MHPIFGTCGKLTKRVGTPFYSSPDTFYNDLLYQLKIELRRYLYKKERIRDCKFEGQQPQKKHLRKLWEKINGQEAFFRSVERERLSKETQV